MSTPLEQLARLYGVQTEYQDVFRQQRKAGEAPLLRILQMLDAPVASLADVPDALRQRHLELHTRTLEPVLVAWQDRPARFELRLPSSQAGGSLDCRVVQADGQVHEWSCRVDDLQRLGEQEVEGQRIVTLALTLPLGLPHGYHRLHVHGAVPLAAEAMLIAAPGLAYHHTEPPERQHQWGTFLPLYALHSKQSWGAGDFADLEALIDWVKDLGGHFVATLPLLASFFRHQNDASPYAPASRLFFNEFYLHLGQQELAGSRRAEELFRSAEVQNEIAQLRSESLAHHPRQMAIKRRVLEQLARELFSGNGPQRQELELHVRQSQHLDSYAKFRATCEKTNQHWMIWPERLRGGNLQPGDYDEQAYQYHLYVQWLVDRQLHQLANHSRSAGMTWYLDLPLGVHRDGYDVWRHPQLFALEASGGAPPDTVFTGGQCWGFPPLHPERNRLDGYQYFINVLRTHLRYAGLLRIDHVMNLHRLYWVPEGMGADQGVYVRYPAEELYAVLCVESHRARAEIIGENLGTVPVEVDEAMNRHALRRMYVVEYEIQDDEQRPLADVPANTIASLNTHDMPQFTAFWQGDDLPDRKDLGLMDESGLAEQQQLRARQRRGLVRQLHQGGHLQQPGEDARTATEACLRMLAASPARFMLINLEDLWGALEPQNTPGTLDQRINWRRRAQRGLESLRDDPQIVRLLRQIAELRRNLGAPREPQLATSGQGADTTKTADR